MYFYPYIRKTLQRGRRAIRASAATVQTTRLGRPRDPAPDQQTVVLHRHDGTRPSLLLPNITFAHTRFCVANPEIFQINTPFGAPIVCLIKPDVKPPKAPQPTSHDITRTPDPEKEPFLNLDDDPEYRQVKAHQRTTKTDAGIKDYRGSANAR